jgi:flagellar FliL protein
MTDNAAKLDQAGSLEEGRSDDSGKELSSGSGRKKLLVLIGGVAILVLLIAGGAGAYFAGLFGGEASSTEASADGASAGGGKGDGAAPKAADPTFYTLPDIVVTLNTGERRTTFLKLRLTLELADGKDIPAIEKNQPRILDFAQTYLRELRLEDVAGAAGTQRLREELLRRIIGAVAPVRVDNVLFSSMLVQ